MIKSTVRAFAVAGIAAATVGTASAQAADTGNNAFEAGVAQVMESLAQQIARDGEGARHYAVVCERHRRHARGRDRDDVR